MRGGYACTAAGRHPPPGVRLPPAEVAGGVRGQHWHPPTVPGRGRPCPTIAYLLCRQLRKGPGPLLSLGWALSQGMMGHGGDTAGADRYGRGPSEPLQQTSRPHPVHHTGHRVGGPCRGFGTGVWIVRRRSFQPTWCHHGRSSGGRGKQQEAPAARGGNRGDVGGRCALRGAMVGI